jgi:hypothetical protein
VRVARRLGYYRPTATKKFQYEGEINFMEQTLINAYGYSNLQLAVLAHFYADQLAKEPDPIRGLEAFRNDVRYHLQDSVFPPNDPDAENIRAASLTAAKHFFKEVQEILVRRKVIDLKDCKF